MCQVREIDRAPQGRATIPEDGVMTLRELAQTWQAEAARLRTRYGLEEMARLCEVHAAELMETVTEAEEEQLTLEQASRESGYSKRRLRELIADKSIPNAGQKGAPRIQRADLPRKTSKSGSNGFDAAEHVSVILGA